MAKALINARVFDGEMVHAAITVIMEGNRISELCTEPVTPDSFSKCWNLDGRLLAPGLIDLQVNGGGGVLFNDEPTVDSIRVMGAAHRRFGTTGFLPTLISDDPGKTERAIDAVRRALAAGVPGVLGVHIEGPFLNADYSGVHDAGHFRSIDEHDFEVLTSLENGRLILTLAPEMTAPGTIKKLAEKGVLVFGGHSAANYQQTRVALQAGMRGFTHLFNAMTPFGSREPGMVGAALEDLDSWTGIIADGQHVHPASFSVALAAKRNGRMVLVTDAMPTVGSDSKSFVLNGETVKSIGGCCRTRDGRLAGSDLDMISAVRNTIRFTGIDRFEALRMASTYPAQALDLDSELGWIKPGYRASMIELDDDLNVRRCWIDSEFMDQPAGAQ